MVLVSHLLCFYGPTCSLLKVSPPRFLTISKTLKNNFLEKAIATMMLSHSDFSITKSHQKAGTCFSETLFAFLQSSYSLMFRCDFDSEHTKVAAQALTWVSGAGIFQCWREAVNLFKSAIKKWRSKEEAVDVHVPALWVQNIDGQWAKDIEYCHTSIIHPLCFPLCCIYAAWEMHTWSRDPHHKRHTVLNGVH